ncbi:MAG: hypothetical protein M3O98_03050 [Actinomycetota bacterium]|nr:hypothetical protein [Actinomycetota bacterium]
MEDGPTVVYMFGPEGPRAQLALGPPERQRVVEWLGGSRRESLAIEAPPLRLSRALIGGTSEAAPAPGIALEWEGHLVGITEVTAEKWAADLGRGEPSQYDAAPDGETVPIRESSAE